MTSRQILYQNKMKCIAAVYISGLKTLHEFEEFLTHLDYDTIEKLQTAAEYAFREKKERLNKQIRDL